MHMNLQTQVNIPKFEGKLIDYTSKIFLLGSCFSQNIGDKLAYFKFDAVQKMQNRLATNTNLRLAMEDLFISLAETQERK